MADPGVLLVLVPDRLSDLVRKGEITERYYNPGDLFSEVHLAMTNDDRPDAGALARTVGRARLVLHNLPAGRGLFLRTLGWRPLLLRRWADTATALAREIRPRLVRCHGSFLNAFAASRIKADLGIPYVVSLHTHPDADLRGSAAGWREWLAGVALRDVERVGLREADIVLAVYQDIEPYLKRLGVTRYRICYNALNPSHLRAKDDYRLHRPVRVISVGRQFHDKNPEQLIRALARLTDVHLTVVGDGVLHDHLRRVAAQCGVAGRTTFERSIPNDRLCAELADYDIFATHNNSFGIPKAVLEPLLCGLPVVVNRRQPVPVSELTPGICRLVEDTPDDYARAIAELIGNDAEREALGRRAYAHARELWAPERSEARIAEVYREVIW